MEKLMNKLLSSLVAATIAGAFSLSAMAADATPVAPAGATAAEKPAAAPKAKLHVKKHVKKHATKKAEEKKSDAAAPAESAKLFFKDTKNRALGRGFFMPYWRETIATSVCAGRSPPRASQVHAAACGSSASLEGSMTWLHSIRTNCPDGWGHRS